MFERNVAKALMGRSSCTKSDVESWYKGSESVMMVKLSVTPGEQRGSYIQRTAITSCKLGTGEIEY